MSMDELEKRSFLNNLIVNNPKMIENNLKNNYVFLKERQLCLELKSYIDKFIEECNVNRYFIIPGIRGVGKTTILYQLYTYLCNEKNIEKNRILFLDLDRLKRDPDFELLSFLDIFLKQINDEYYLTSTPLFIFVDESQYVDDWDLIGKILYDENSNVFMIFTGSNALNLEISADSSRRAIKKQLYPMNFREYLNLKYDYNISTEFTHEIMNTILTGEINTVTKHEKEIQINDLLNLERNIDNEWIDFLQYGDLPLTIRQNKFDNIEKTTDIVDKIIEKDMDILSSITSTLRLSTYKLVTLLATQKPGDISLNKLANILNISKSSVENLLKILEKTQLLFSIDAYGSPSKKIRTSSEYYFLSTQIKASFFIDNGDLSRDPRQYLGILTENLVASTLYRLKNVCNNKYGISYDSKKGGVDFIITTMNGKIIPIEVGIGKKNKKQIIKAINNYNSDYGIIISNTTNQIVKEENIIYIPLVTFSLA